MESLFIIIGLGNPGSRYENTRHNVGFNTIDLLAYKHNIKVTKLKHKALIGDGTINGRKVVLVKPQTYMNLSGESVREILQWYKASLGNTIVIYDDIDLPLGKIRIRARGSSGTHNGMKSVIYQIQSDEFPRIRIGIGKPPDGWDLVDYVIGKFSNEDMEAVNESIQKAADAVLKIIEYGINGAMNTYNRQI